MTNPDLESRILELAQLRGIIVPADLECPLEEQDEADVATWGPRVAALVRTGRLSREMVQTLTQDLMQVPMFTLPSWQPEERDAANASGRLAWKGYKDLQPLGMGGGGMVYKAKDPQLDRWVALKFLRNDQPWKLSRVLREARAQASVDHPNVVKVYEVGEHEGQPFIAMQLVQGSTLREIQNRVTLEQKVRILMQVAEGLHAAHQMGLVHLDIKPPNILVEFTDQGEARPFLTDFGLVREENLEGQSTGYGTPPFASPEQLAGDVAHLDRRSDVFSLGATLYFLLVGVPPFDTTDIKILANADPIPLRSRDPRMPLDLEAITSKCLRRDPNERYSSARAVAEDLRRFMNGEPVQARHLTWSYRASMWFRRNKLLAILGGTAALLLLSLGILSWRTARRSAIQINLAVRYGQEVQAMEQLLRMAHLSRVHDRRPTVDLVRKAMGRIRDDMVQLGPNAVGPGSYALGEGYFTLGEMDEARNYLDKAWKANFRTPACAKTRGLVLAELYQRAKSQIVSDDPNHRTIALQLLDAEYRNPALECYRVARETSVNTPYQEAMAAYQKAMEAYLQEDLEGAIARTQEAGNRTPWLYETDVLRHTFHMELAKDLLDEGRIEEAKNHLELAGQALDCALSIAPSDPWNWDGKGYWCFAMADLPDTSREEQLSWVKRACSAFETAIVVDRDHFEAYGGLSSTYARLADFARARGEDPLPYLDRGVEYSETGVKLTPPSEVNAHLSWALTLRGEESLLRGGDPRQDLDRAIVGFRKAADRGGNADMLKGLQTALFLRGQAAYVVGDDAAPYLQESVIWADKASQANFGNAEQRCQALGRRVDRAELELRLKRDLTEPLEPIVSELASLVEKNPRESGIYFEWCKSLLISAEYKIVLGSDPRPAFEECTRAMKSLKALAPDDPDIQESLAEFALIQGRWMLQNHVNPASVLKAGIVSVKADRALRPWYDYSKALEFTLKALLAQSTGDMQSARKLEADIRKITSRNAFAEKFLKPLKS